MTALVVAVVALVALVVFMAISRRQAAEVLVRSATVELTCDDDGLRRELADGRVEEVRWDQVDEVEVLTASRGPHGAAGGVIIIGDGEERGCLVPLDRAEPTGVLAQLARLEGFDHPAFVAAVEARAGTRTTVWKR
jgi:hypothetical protein